MKQVNLNTTILVIAFIAFCLSSGIMLGVSIKTIRTMNTLKLEAIKAQAKSDALEAILASRFAYVTADMDAAKSQIRELNSSVGRLSNNGLKLISYLEGREKTKNAYGRR